MDEGYLDGLDYLMLIDFVAIDTLHYFDVLGKEVERNQRDRHT